MLQAMKTDVTFRAHRTPRQKHTGLPVRQGRQMLIILADLVLVLLIADTVHASRPAALVDMEKAKELYAAGKYQDALNIYDEMIKHYKVSSYAQEIFYRKGLCLSAMERFPEAAEAWEMVFKKYRIGPLRDDALLELARMRAYKMNQHDLALRDYEQFCKIFTRSDRLSEARYQIAGVYYLKGEYAGAKELLEAFLKEYPSTSVTNDAQQEAACP